ncbi:MAG: hypothetical protein ACOYLQ_09620 [Hyphomicrobiaceae bacterium]
MTDIHPIESIERRVLRAIRTLGVLRDREADWLRYKACWPATLVEWSDLLAQAENPDLEAKPARFEPTRSDLGDYLTALSWWARLAPGPRRPGRLRGDQLIVMLVAYEFSFKSIGQRMEFNRHEDTIRRRYRMAIKQCHELANADAFAAARTRAEQAFRPQARPQAGSRAAGRR